MNVYSMKIIGIYSNVFSLNIKIKVSKNNLSEESVEMEKIHDCDFEILSDFIVFLGALKVVHL